MGTTNSKIKFKPTNQTPKKAVRIMSNSAYNAHTGPLLKQFGILKIEDVINLELIKIGYMFTKSLLPNPVMALFNPNAINHRLPTN